MNDFYEIIFNLYTYLSIIPTLVGIFFYKKLNSVFKILFYYQFLGNFLTCISILMANIKNTNTHFIFYLSIVLSAISYSLFFYALFKKQKWMFLLFPFSMLIYLGFDAYLNGVKQLNIIPYIFIDLFNIGACFQYFYKSKKTEKSIHLIIRILLIYSLYDIVFNFSSSYFYNYLSESVFNLIWNLINPIIGIVYYLFLAYSFYFAAKKSAPNFNNIAEFE